MKENLLAMHVVHDKPHLRDAITEMFRKWIVLEQNKTHELAATQKGMVRRIAE